jgi:hypothetical protein
MDKKTTDTNMAIKNPDGELDNSFLLDDGMPKASPEFIRHMAQTFKDMGMSGEEIKLLISQMK